MQLYTIYEQSENHSAEQNYLHASDKWNPKQKRWNFPKKDLLSLKNLKFHPVQEANKSKHGNLAKNCWTPSRCLLMRLMWNSKCHSRDQTQQNSHENFSCKYSLSIWIEMLERDNRDGRLQLEMFETAKKLVGSRLPCNLRAVRLHIGHSHEEGEERGWGRGGSYDEQGKGRG